MAIAAQQSDVLTRRKGIDSKLRPLRWRKGTVYENKNGNAPRSLVYETGNSSAKTKTDLLLSLKQPRTADPTKKLNYCL